MREEYFDLNEQHIELLRHAYVQWCSDEFGAPCIDPKRPYGNSDVYGDITKILGLTEPNEDGEYSKSQTQFMDVIHRETRKALQVIFCSRSFTPGRYRGDGYTTWELVEPSPV